MNPLVGFHCQRGTPFWHTPNALRFPIAMRRKNPFAISDKNEHF
jgi:hypothetical protein